MAGKGNKTVETHHSVEEFLQAVEHVKRKEDAIKLLKAMEQCTGEKAKMWGNSIVGFGKYHYKYESGREGDAMKVGFSPRKTSLVLYIMTGFERYDTLMKRLGKFKTGKSCLYIHSLEDIDEGVLKDLIQSSYDYMTKKYG